MMRAPLPRELGRSFSVQEAARAGVSRGRLRSKDLVIPFRGVRSHAEDETDDGAEARIAALVSVYRRIMPSSQFFTGATAAVLWNLPLPRAALRGVIDRGIDVGVFAPAQFPRREGVAGHRVHPVGAHVTTHPHLGLRLTTPASTWAALGAVLEGPYDLVAVGDAVVRERMFRGDPPPLASVDQLVAAAGAIRRVGAPALRAALPRIRTRAASRRETICRLLLVDAGLAEPLLNHEVRDGAGRVIACVDLAYPEARVAIEYEGEHHLRDPAQWARDVARYEALAAAGWFVIRVTASHLADGGSAFVSRVRTALAR